MRKVIVIVDLYVANVVRALNVTYLVILRAVRALNITYGRQRETP